MPWPDTDVPLVVDLDGTFINTDLLYEGIILLMRKNPLYIFSCILWLVKGKVYLKNKLFSLVHIDPESLPYNRELIHFLQNEHSKGRKLILATASLYPIACKISKVFPIFDKIYGTESINLKGKNKLEFLIQQHGKSKFDYIGNSNSDVIIFASSRYSYLVNAKKSLEKKTKKVSDLRHVWNSGNGLLRNYLLAIRAYQWIKNLLIFVPLVTSHSFDGIHFINAFCGFVAFSLVASAGYIINDMLDLESDRVHLRKRYRPLASGNLSIPAGAILAVILFGGGILVGALLNFQFLIVLLFYFMTSLSYSVYLKKIALYDVFVLAFLYSIRVVAGAISIGVSLSSWLIAFSTFLFLSLAFVKRYSELIQVKKASGLINKGREYSIEDLGLLQIMGTVSGFLSVIVFSLYIDSSEVKLLYANPKLLGIISFLFLFWISRMWLVTTRGRMTDDPIIFALKDKSSYFIFLITGVIFWFAM